MRVLHAPVNIGNQAWNLSRAERRLGVRSDLVTNYTTWLGYRSDVCMGAAGAKGPVNLARRLWHGFTSPLRYDIVHYYFGRSLLCWDDLGARNRLWYRDLHLARRLGRKVFMTLQGCDVRLAGESNRANEITMCRPGACPNFEACIGGVDAQRRRLIDEILPLCDRVFYLNPELGHFVPGGEFMPYANVDVESFTPTPPKTTGPVRILHAPSDPGIKGTPFVLEAIDTLQRNHDVELVLVQNVPHEKAVELYASADIVVDQVLSGWYGGLAVEVMAMGKPVACYLREADLDVLPPAMRRELPVLDVTPTTLADRLAEAIADRSSWPDWSRRCRDFVLRWHHPDRIAAAMVAAYERPETPLTITGEEHVVPCAG